MYGDYRAIGLRPNQLPPGAAIGDGSVVPVGMTEAPEVGGSSDGECDAAAAAVGGRVGAASRRIAASDSQPCIVCGKASETMCKVCRLVLCSPECNQAAWNSEEHFGYHGNA
jgi:hypothetical protein